MEREAEQQQEIKKTFSTIAELQTYAKQRYNIDDVISKLEDKITPVDYWEKWDMVEEEIRKFMHWGEEYWKRVYETRTEKLAELNKMYGYAPDLFAKLKELDEAEYQYWVDYSAVLEIVLRLLWARGAVCYNTYGLEHRSPKGLEEAEVKALEKTAASLLAFAEARGVKKEVLDVIVKKAIDDIQIERRAAIEKEEARIKEIEQANINYIRQNRDSNGEVKWSDLRLNVAAHFTHYEWERVTKKQKNIGVRRERHGSRLIRFVYEVDEKGNKVLGDKEEKAEESAEEIEGEES
jgi:hypothetical protein